jgi:surface protein
MNLSNWDTGNVTAMRQTFYRCSQFRNGNDPGINNWNTSKVTTMAEMFYQCGQFNQPLGNWDVSAVIDMFAMLQQTPFNQDISGWNVGKVRNMAQLFYFAGSFNQDIGDWDITSVTNMSNMFNGATAFNQDISRWNIGNVTNFTNFMASKTDLTFSSSNLDAIYNGWGSQNVKPGITISFGTAKYSAAGASGRAALISKGWTIIDGGQIEE